MVEYYFNNNKAEAKFITMLSQAVELAITNYDHPTVSLQSFSYSQ